MLKVLIATTLALAVVSVNPAVAEESDQHPAHTSASGSGHSHHHHHHRYPILNTRCDKTNKAALTTCPN